MAHGRRRTPSRAERLRGLIVTEGTVTEPQYLQLLKQQLPRASASVTVKGAGQDPLSVLDKCIELRAEAKVRGKPYDWCCCVVDVDEHVMLERCLVEARRSAVEVVVTNLKFEVWLLWHCIDLGAARTSRQLDDLARRHGVLVGKDLSARFPVGNYLDAVTRARTADPELATRRTGPNPSSSMPALLDLMNRTAGASDRA